MARATFLVENGFQLLADDTLESEHWKKYRAYTRANSTPSPIARWRIISQGWDGTDGSSRSLKGMRSSDRSQLMLRVRSSPPAGESLPCTLFGVDARLLSLIFTFPIVISRLFEYLAPSDTTLQ
ncbi:hypothetical protein BH20ACI3_BH20ACI3_22310 [soil metagenome]